MIPNKNKQEDKKNTSLILSRLLLDALSEVEEGQLYGLNRSEIIRNLLTEKLAELGYIKKPK